MNTVWKFELNTDDCNEINLPVGSTPLSVQEQNGHVQLWCLCNPNETNYEVRKFRMAGTGHPIKETDIRFIGTFQLFGGGFVGHLFEINE